MAVDNDVTPTRLGRLLAGVLAWVRALIVALIVVLPLRWTIGEPFKIPSGSMEPTLYGDMRFFRGDRIFVDKWTYGLRYPLNHCRIPFTQAFIRYADKRIWRKADAQRWDIVVFKSAEPNPEHPTLVKRVVGLPGERIHISGGCVYVNGKALELPPGMPDVYYTSPGPGHYADPRMKYGIMSDDEYSLIPKDHYLLLGDNSARSRDGRFFGWVPNERIMGRALCIWWPPAHWLDFAGFSSAWWWRTLVALALALIVLRVFFFRLWAVHDGRRARYYLINRWSFGVPIPFTRLRLGRGRIPRRGELVLYHTPKHTLMGRVAGWPGERVSIENGKLSIDGKPLAEPAPLAAQDFGSQDKAYSKTPPDAFFILTQTEDCLDSRALGAIPRKNLVGPAVGREL